MASFFKVPADWDFHQSEEYETEHPGSAVNFGLRKSARKENLGAYLYRYPGDWSFEQIDKQASEGKGGALDYELGQYGPYTPPSTPANFKFAFRMLDRVGNPIPNQEVHVRIEDTATAPEAGGVTQNVKTNASGVATISMGGYGNPSKYLSLTPYNPKLARNANKAIIWRFPITLGTSDPAPINIVFQPGGGIQYNDVIPGAPPRPTTPVLGPTPDAGETNWGQILGIGALVIGIGFLGYQLYKGAKAKKAAPALHPV